MSIVDSQLLHVHRQPICQKRLSPTDNYISVSRARSPTARKNAFVSRRRHSTPQASSLRIVHVKSPHSNSALRHYHVSARRTRMIKEQPLKPDRRKSLPRPTTLVKPRHQDDRSTRIPSTPTNLNLNTEIFLPIAKKNRTTIIDTPSPGVPDLQSMDHSVFPTKQWNKRQKAFSFDFGSDVFISEEDSLRADTRHRNSTKRCTCCYDKCSCGFPYCTFHPCHNHCAFYCWITCFLLALGFIIGIFILMDVLSR